MTVFVLKIAHEGVMRTRAIGEGASACAGLLEHRFNLTQHPTVIRQNGVVYAVEFACS
jgi:hypothetical protein